PMRVWRSSRQTEHVHESAIGARGFQCSRSSDSGWCCPLCEWSSDTGRDVLGLVRRQRYIRPALTPPYCRGPPVARRCSATSSCNPPAHGLRHSPRPTAGVNRSTFAGVTLSLLLFLRNRRNGYLTSCSLSRPCDSIASRGPVTAVTVGYR